LVEKEKTAHHWIGVRGDMVIVFAYEGSHSDPRHIEVASLTVRQLASELGRPVKLLFVIHAKSSKPPNAAVRAAVSEHIPKFERLVSQLSIVATGTGFLAAIHRGAMTGLLTVAGPKAPFKMSAALREGLAYLLTEQSAGFAEVLAACEALHARG
jgi:hypothetical protein